MPVVAAMGCALATVAPGSGAQAQEAPPFSPPSNTKSVMSLPETTYRSTSVSQLAIAADHPADRLVAEACTPGQGISVSEWLSFRPAAETTVTARTQLRSNGYGRGSSLTHAGGIAVLRLTTGEVLACATGTGEIELPTHVVDPEGVHIVAFTSLLPRPTGFFLDYAASVSLFVGETTGVRPSNDDVADAIRIDAAPYSHTIDRQLATTQPQDFDWPRSSWLPGNLCEHTNYPVRSVHKSIWYQLVPAEDIVVNPVDPTASPSLQIDGAAQIGEVIATEDPSLLRDPRCGPEHPTLVLRTGRTYVLQVADYNWFGLHEGGPVDQGQPRTLTVTGTGRLLARPAVTLDRAVTAVVLPADGSLVLQGDLTCRGGSVTVTGEVEQVKGRSTRRGSVTGTLSAPCDDTLQRWRATVTPIRGRFLPGTVRIRVTAVVDNAVDEPARDGLEASVRVKAGRPGP